MREVEKTQTFKELKAFAMKDIPERLKGFELKRVGDAWYLGKPTTVIDSVYISFLPYHIALCGDMGDQIYKLSDRESLRWCLHTRISEGYFDYIISKRLWKQDTFFHKDAVESFDRWIKDLKEEEDTKHATEIEAAKAQYLKEVDYTWDYERSYYEAWQEAGYSACEVSDCVYPTYRDFYHLFCLDLFATLYKKAYP